MFSSPLIHDVRVDAIAIVGDLWTNEKVEQVPPGTAQYNEHRVGMMGDGLEPHSLRVFAVLTDEVQSKLPSGSVLWRAMCVCCCHIVLVTPNILSLPVDPSFGIDPNVSCST